MSVDIEVTSIGIYSDHQPFFALLLLNGDRPARIRDCVWSERFSYVDELVKLGAKIERRAGEIRVLPSKLRGVSDVVLVANDLRAAATLLLAATMAKCSVRLRGAEHLSRGYEDIFLSLGRFGAVVHV